MTLNAFVENIQKMIAEEPALGYMKVVTASDGEGNSFEEVYFSPSPGSFSDEQEFVAKSNLEEEWEDYGFESKEDALDTINAICIN